VLQLPESDLSDMRLASANLPSRIFGDTLAMSKAPVRKRFFETVFGLLSLPFRIRSCTKTSSLRTSSGTERKACFTQVGVDDPSRIVKPHNDGANPYGDLFPDFIMLVRSHSVGACPFAKHMRAD
jgi:hypothetical protein